MPLALIVVTAIAPSDSTTARASVAASAAPPPKMINGFFADLSKVAACAMALGAAAGRELLTIFGNFR